MRLIPKITKSNSLFGAVTGIDIVMWVIGIAIAIMLGFSNFFGDNKIGSISLAVIFIAVYLPFLFTFKEKRLYIWALYAYKYHTKPKDVTGLAQTAMLIQLDGIENGYINYRDGQFGKIVEIDGVNFFTMSAMQRADVTATMADCFRNCNEKSTMQLFKCERPIDYRKFIDSYQFKKFRISNDITLSEQECTARLAILSAQLEELEKMQNEDRQLTARYYYIVKGASKAIVDEKIAEDVALLNEHGLYSSVINATETAIVLKYLYCYTCNESEINNLSADKHLEWILPKNIKYNSDSTEIDGVKLINFNVLSYPNEAIDGWGNNFFNERGNNVLVNMAYCDPTKVINNINSLYANISSERKGKLEDRQNREELKTSLAGLMSNLKDNREIMLNTSIYITAKQVSGKDSRSKQKALRRCSLGVARGKYTQESLYNAKIGADKDKNSRKNLSGEVLGYLFPFTRSNIMDENGIYIGKVNNVPAIVDFNKRDGYHTNGNMFITGMIGSGKSFGNKTLLANLASADEVIRVLDPSPEYDTLAYNLGGKVIDMGNGEHKINPLQVLISDDKNMLTAHLSLLKEFFNSIFKGVDIDVVELLNKLLADLYARRGIDNNFDFDKAKPEDYPIMGDLKKLIEARSKQETNVKMKELYERLLLHVEQFVSGRYAELWNGKSELVLDSNFIVFDFHTLLNNDDITLATGQMQLVSAFINAELMRNYNKMRSLGKVLPDSKDGTHVINVVVDEAHRFLSPDNTIIVRKLKELAKQCRKYGAKLISITQSCVDFLATPQIEFLTKALMTEVQYSMFFKASPTHMVDIDKIFGTLELTEIERKRLVLASVGETLFIDGGFRRNQLKVIANTTVRNAFEKSGKANIN